MQICPTCIFMKCQTSFIELVQSPNSKTIALLEEFGGYVLCSRKFNSLFLRTPI